VRRFAAWLLTLPLRRLLRGRADLAPRTLARRAVPRPSFVPRLQAAEDLTLPGATFTAALAADWAIAEQTGPLEVAASQHVVVQPQVVQPGAGGAMQVEQLAALDAALVTLAGPTTQQPDGSSVGLAGPGLDAGDGIDQVVSYWQGLGGASGQPLGPAIAGSTPAQGSDPGTAHGGGGTGGGGGSAARPASARGDQGGYGAGTAAGTGQAGGHAGPGGAAGSADQASMFLPQAQTAAAGPTAPITVAASPGSQSGPMATPAGSLGITQTMPASPTSSSTGTPKPTTNQTSSPGQQVSGFGQVPLSFELNVGQVSNPSVLALAHTAGMDFWLTGQSMVFAVPHSAQQADSQAAGVRLAPRGQALQSAAPAGRDVFTLEMVGAGSDVQVVGDDPLGGRSNYFIGHDASQWHTDVTQYGRLEERNVYQGIDLALHSQAGGGSLEYDFVVHPGADAASIRLNAQGLQHVTLDSQGRLLLGTSGGDVVMDSPQLYQTVNGQKQAVEGRYRLDGAGQLGFEVTGSYDHTKDLVIDPVIGFSTLIGGTGDEAGYAIAVDTSGNSHITGYTSSTDFPVQNGYQMSPPGPVTAFVTKLNAQGTGLVYSTYLGGSNSTNGTSPAAIAVDSTGSAYVVGGTYCTDFPITPGAFQPSYGTVNEMGFVTKLSPQGNSLAYSTFLGSTVSSGVTSVNGVAVDAYANTYVTGYTSDGYYFPTTAGAFQTTTAGGGTFVTKLNPNGTGLVYSTLLAPSSDTKAGSAIAVDTLGNAYVTGGTSETNFPTVNAYQSSLQGYSNAFVSELNSTGSTLSFSTYLGGSGDDGALGIAIGLDGKIYVTGVTDSINFPTSTGAFQSTLNGPAGATNAFVTVFNPAGNGLVSSSYLGGGYDVGNGIAVDRQGQATVVGYTGSTTFPTYLPFQTNITAVSYAAFVTRFTPTGSLSYSSCLGGCDSNFAYGVAVDASGAVYVVGETNSQCFPTTPGAYQRTLAGGFDAFVVKVLPGTNFPPSLVPDDGTGDNFDFTSDLVHSNPNTSGNVPQLNSQDLVRYNDGVVRVATTDLEADGFGMPWGQTRSWSNGPGYATGSANGSGWVDTQLPSLQQAGPNTVVEVSNSTTARYFDLVGGTYQPRFYDQSQLVYQSSSKQFVLTDSSGDQIHFYDFSTAWPVNQRGQFKSFVGPAGSVTAVTDHTNYGNIAEVQRSTTSGGNTVTESWLYSYVTTCINSGLLASVTLRRQVNGGDWSVVRQVQYAYYDGTQPYGNVGDLLTATLQDGSGNILDTNYYRYYTTADAGTIGYEHALKYVFSAASYGRLVAAVGDPQNATDAQVAPFADDYLEYDAQHRVSKLMGQGDGGTSGLGTFTYTYTPSGNAPGINSWAVKTTEVLPDGNENIVYTNDGGEVMLGVYHDTASGLSWETYNKYDPQGRLILRALPSAVTGYDDSKPDLVNNNQYLSNTSGQIQIIDWYTSTSGGGVAGYLQDTKLQQGLQGTPILQGTTQYTTQTAGSVTIHPVASDTVYRNTDGTGAETTNYAYTYFGGTQVQSVTVTRPVISAAQNGPGVADTETTFYDSYGRPIWTKDGDGFLSYTQYDPATGGVVKTIEDVDTTKTADFQDLPPGWSTPAGGGLHLITQMVVDALGRPTQQTSPAGNLTYTVYNDPNNEVRVYPGFNSGTGTTTGPIEVSREDRAGGYTESYTMSATPHLTGGVPDGTEAPGNLQTLSRIYTNAAGQAVETDDYFNLGGVAWSTAPHLGTAGTNYYVTQTGYDTRGRASRTVTANGTIYRTVYDGLGRSVSTWVGTNDTPGSGSWSPSNNTAPANMVQTSGMVYDSGGVGDGDLTQQTDFPGGSAAPRVTQSFYDWRDRPVASKSGVQGSENDGTHRPIGFTTYDNLDEVTQTQQYDGDTVSISTANGQPQTPAANLLRAQASTQFDDQGRLFQSQVFDVNPSTGAVLGSPLTTNDYYDHRGDLIAESAPGGLWDKTVFDGAGDAVLEYSTDGAGGTTWATAASVASDTVLEQVQTVYDADSNAIETIDRQRFHNASGTGPLGNPTSGIEARVSSTANYFDSADRLIASVDVGSNGGSGWSRPSTIPAPTASVLVTTMAYNAAGWVQDVTDPMGIDARSYYDNLGRTTKSVQDYTNGTVTAESNATMEFGYDGDNNVVFVQADEPGGASQRTQYVYGVSTASGSGVNSNDLLAAKQHPDATTGTPSSSQQDPFQVNTLGQVTMASDRNGNVHQFGYDVLGRVIRDAVTTLGAGVDGSVRRIEYGYDTQGNLALITSYDAPTGGNIVNQVQRAFDGLGQMTTEWQSHSGPVNTATTPAVRYAYTEMAGGANNSRLSSLTYPSGYVLTYNYGAGVDASTSRVSSLSDSTGVLESYKYLGLDTVVERDHPQNNVNLTYIQQPGDGNASTDGGDPYTGLDRFGQVIDQNWLNATTGTSTDRLQYGHDPNGEVTYRQNLSNATFSELYQYDSLQQLTSMQRGTLNANHTALVGTPTHSQSWSPDALGNFSGVTTDGTTQTRSHNQQNEITSISGAGAVSYDANGNLTADGSGKSMVYDAWDRLVGVKQGSTTLAAYGYDGLDRRITGTHGSTTRDLYYSDQWQVLEERVGGVVQARNVWGTDYVDELVLRDQSSLGNGVLDQRLYVQQDANWNVTALVDTNGNVVERYVYDAYGAVTVLTPGWALLAGSAYNWLYMHQGGRYDAAVGLYSLRNRDYSPTLMRWLQNDPAGFAAGDSNLYRDVGNDPTDATDPTGLAAPWNWMSWQDVPGVNIPFVAYYWGVQFQQWRKGRALDAQLDEVIAKRQAQVDIVAAAGNPNGPWNGATGSSVGAGVNGLTNPNFNRNRAQAADDAGMLANGAVQWNAGAAGFAGSSRVVGSAIRGGTRRGTGQSGVTRVQGTAPARVPPISVPGLSNARVAHFNRPGYQNYRLETNVGTAENPIWRTYYHGYIRPGETQTAIRTRHAGTVGPDGLARFNPATDRLVVEPGTRLYGEARLMEYRNIVRDQTNKGRVKVSGTRRVNNQNGLQPAKLQEYEAWERALNGQ
jgi:RHS repeat-associated protein